MLAEEEEEKDEVEGHQKEEEGDEIDPLDAFMNDLQQNDPDRKDNEEEVVSEEENEGDGIDGERIRVEGRNSDDEILSNEEQEEVEKKKEKKII